MLREMRKELYIHVLGQIVAQDLRNAAKAIRAINLLPVIRARISFRGESRYGAASARNPIRIGERRKVGKRRGILLENCGRSENIRAPLSPGLRRTSEARVFLSGYSGSRKLYIRAREAKLTRKEAI